MTIQMNSLTRTHYRQTGAARQGVLISLLVLVLILIFAWFMLPKGFNKDTSLIGKGKPAIVLIYSYDSVMSTELMEEFNKIRGEYADRVEFLIVDVNAPGGKEFISANGVSAPGALFFSSGGRKVTELYSPAKAPQLKNMMQQAFGF